MIYALSRYFMFLKTHINITTDIKHKLTKPRTGEHVLKHFVKKEW